MKNSKYKNKIRDFIINSDKKYMLSGLFLLISSLSTLIYAIYNVNADTSTFEEITLNTEVKFVSDNRMSVPESYEITKIYTNNGTSFYFAASSSSPKITSIVPPTASGKTFNGFKHGSSSNFYINSDGTFNTNLMRQLYEDTSSDKTLTASWTTIVHQDIQINLNANGGTQTGITSFCIFTDGTNHSGGCASSVGDVIQNISVPTKSGYVFKGYIITEGTKEIEIISSSGSLMPGINKTNVLSKSVYTATAKWSLDTSGSSSSSTTSGPSIQVNLDHNGGTSSTSVFCIFTDGTNHSGGCSSPGDAIQNISIPTKSGYVFKGYIITEGTKEIEVISSSGSLMPGINKTNVLSKSVYTATAKWEANSTSSGTTTAGPSIQVNLDHNGGTNSTSAFCIFTDGTNHSGGCSSPGAEIQNISIPTKSGYTFKGYKITTSSNAEVVIVDSSGSLMQRINQSYTLSSSVITATAKWESNSTSSGTTEVFQKINLDTAVKFNSTNRLGVPDYATITSVYTNNGTNFYLGSTTASPSVSSIIPPTKEGYTFKGFKHASGSSTTYISETGTFNTSIFTAMYNAAKNYNQSLVAVFEKNSSSDSSSTDSSGSSSSTGFSSESSSTISKSTVTLDGGGGIVGNDNNIYISDGKMYSDSSLKNEVTKVDIPTKDGYTFDGYYVSNTQVIDKEGNIISSSLSSLTSPNVTFTAKWTENADINRKCDQIVALDANGGTQKINYLCVSADGKTIYSGNSSDGEKITKIDMPEKDEMVFLGYFYLKDNYDNKIAGESGTYNPVINSTGEFNSVAILGNSKDSPTISNGAAGEDYTLVAKYASKESFETSENNTNNDENTNNGIINPQTGDINIKLLNLLIIFSSIGLIVSILFIIKAKKKAILQ